MALNNTGIVHCRSDATNAASKGDYNGAGFDPALIVTAGSTGVIADLTTSAASGTSSTPTVTSATYSFVSGDIGNYLYLAEGQSGWIGGWYLITAAPSGGATLAAAIGQVVLSINQQPAKMNTVAGCSSTVSPTIGICSIDYSQVASPVLDGGTVTWTPASNGSAVSATLPTGMTVAMIGNLVVISPGNLALPGFLAGQYFALTKVGVASATLDRTPTNSYISGGAPMYLGGSVLTPGQLGFLQTATKAGGAGATTCPKTAFVQALGTDYVMSASASPNKTAGQWAGDLGTGPAQTRVIGFTSNRWIYNTDAQPTIQAQTTNGQTMFTLVAGTELLRLIIDGGLTLGTPITGTIPYTATNGNRIQGCIIQNCGGIGTANSQLKVEYCDLINNGLSGSAPAFNFSNGQFFACYVAGNIATASSGVNVSLGSSGFAKNCIFANNTAPAVLLVFSAGSSADDCSFYKSSAADIETESITPVKIRNCYSSNCGTYFVLNSSGGQDATVLEFNSVYAPGTARTIHVNWDIGPITPGSEQFVAPASNNFAMVPGSVNLGAGVPNASNYRVGAGTLSPNSYPDIGALQQTDTTPPATLLFSPPAVIVR